MQWGPQRVEEGGWRFNVWAPDREAITLEFEDGRSIPMEPAGEGWLSVTTEAAAGASYRFRLDPTLAVPDPASRAQRGGPHGWSVLPDPDGYDWKCTGWRGRPWHEAVIQEVHAGLLGGFAGVAERLPAMADLGITAVELMPVAAFAGERGWGYDGVLPYAVHEAYGTPADLKALVDRAHELDLMIFLDVVYNHFGPDGNFLHAYAEPFFDATRHTPWGPGIASAREPVQRFFIDNARMWLDEFRFDGLRFDAIHAIGDSRFLDAMASELRETVGDRHVHLILENEANDAGRLAEGRFDAQWNDDFHNTVHVLLTDETEGYYAGFAQEPTNKLARCLTEGFVYQGESPPGPDARPRGSPSGHLPPVRFVSFLQNHDQIGNRALGERLTVLAERDKLRAVTALLLLAPQIPLIFMGDEAGSRSPFLFFTDFHDELADAVREGRRREFADFRAFAKAEDRERIPDPNDALTFAASIPVPGPDAEEWRGLYAELLQLRHRHIVPRLAGAKSLGAEVLAEGAVSARWRMGDGATLTLAINLGRERAQFGDVPGPLFTLGASGEPGSFVCGIES
ncbi:malto-oligosyltrehalose trehalohydrolase [Croceibacterium aestuarii]|uniref:malto-oligosyltrehalose trehalohydrolase n=1 Tax=Croceibacterium aestuarii TaxID=3064139 RepID=UPI00272EE21F|nr:malto-oligosyltrehalose trehalohydrolase [Croceibacterium sp. D39]